MRHTWTIILLIAFVGAPFLSDAQILRRLRSAAEEGISRAVEKRVVSEVEKATQRQFEKAFGDLYGGDRNGTGYDFSKILESINTNVEIKDSYAFSGFAAMEITGTEENGKASDPVTMKTYLSGNEHLTGMEFTDEESKKNKERSIMIFDFESNVTILLAEREGEKTRMAFGMDWQKMMESAESMPVETEEEEVTNSLEDLKFEKTGQTKTIFGYTCDEYSAETEDLTASYWVSRDPVPGLQTFWGSNSPFLTQKMKAENKMNFDNFPDGSLMEMVYSSKKDKSSSQLKVTAIDADAAQMFVMSDYSNALGGN